MPCRSVAPTECPRTHTQSPTEARIPDLLVMSSTILTLDGRPLYVLGSAQLATTQTTWRVAAEGATGGGNEGMWAALCAQGSIVNTIP